MAPAQNPADPTPADGRGPGYEFAPAGYQPAHLRLSDLPAALAEGGRGAGYLPLVQFIKDWNRTPWRRGAMLDGALPGGTPREAAAKIAAVIAALCDEAGRAAPEWIAGAVAARDVALVPGVDLDSPFGRDIVASAPPACRRHRVYFGAELLDST